MTEVRLLYFASLRDRAGTDAETRDTAATDLRALYAELQALHGFALPVERLRVAVESATFNGQPVRLPARVDLGWYHGVLQESDDSAQPQRLSGDLCAGERWAMTVRLKQPHGARNPQGFDYELWLWEQGVGATGYVRAGPRDEVPQRLAHTWRHPVERVRQAVRDAIFDYLAPDATVAQQQRLAGVVAALVTGDQRAIERSEWDLFRTTGVSHLMSISGLHITLFAWLAAAAL